MSSTPYTNATAAELETPVPQVERTELENAMQAATDSATTEMKTVDKDDVVSVTSTVKIEPGSSTMAACAQASWTLRIDYPRRGP